MLPLLVNGFQMTILLNLGNVDFKDELFEGCFCIVGLDLSSVGDITAISTMIEIDNKFYFKNFYFLLESALEESSNREIQNMVSTRLP